jgi:tRNA(adenine34) deaminase
MTRHTGKIDSAAATDLDLAMMARALAQARLAAEAGEVPVGSVVYRGEELLAEAHNLRESLQDPTAHAEVLALRSTARKLGTWRFEECSLAVTLEPCPMCAGALVNARMARLVYGAADPKMGCVDTLHQLCTDPRFNHRLKVVRGVMADQCAAVLKAFFRQRRSEEGRERTSPPE